MTDSSFQTPSLFVGTAEEPNTLDKVTSSIPKNYPKNLILPKIQNYKLLGSSVSLQSTVNDKIENSLSLTYSHNHRKDDKVVLHILLAKCPLACEIQKSDYDLKQLNHKRFDDKVVTIFHSGSFLYVLVNYSPQMDKAKTVAESLKANIN